MTRRKIEYRGCDIENEVLRLTVKRANALLKKAVRELPEGEVKQEIIDYLKQINHMERYNYLEALVSDIKGYISGIESLRQREYETTNEYRGQC